MNGFLFKTLAQLTLHKKKKTVLFFCIMLSISAFAQKNDTQKIDSLKTELKKTKTDTVRINILNEICRYYFYSNPVTGAGYSEIALDLSTKINWKKGIAVAYNHLGICSWINQKNEKAISCFKKSLVCYKELKDQNNIADNYNQLGTVYCGMGQYSQALVYFNAAYKINIKIHNILQTANNLTGIADIYFKTDNYQKALDNYIEAHQKYQYVSNIFGMGLTSFSIGKTYAMQKKYSKALEHYDKALVRFTETKNLYHVGNAYFEIGKANYNLYFENKKEKSKILNTAIKNFKEAIKFYTNNNNYDKVNECNIELTKTYETIGDYKQALATYKNYVNIDQTFLTYDKENKLAELKTEREFETKNNQIEIQQFKIKNDTRKVYLLVTITGSIAILLVLFLWLYVSKRKTNQLLLDKNQEILNINKQKDKFFSIIAHDLRGPFNGFLGLTELLAEEIDNMDKEEIQFAAVNMRSSANNLNRLLDNLLEWSRMEQGLIPFSPKEMNLDETVKECIAPLRDAANKKNIAIKTFIDQSIQVFADKNLLHSVIRNIVSNAVKFTPKKGMIKIQAQEDIDNTVISITDSGIGMDAKMVKNIFLIEVKTNRRGTEDEPSSGLGLILCKEFVEKHNGKIWIESEEGKGTTFHVSFPKNNTAKIA